MRTAGRAGLIVVAWLAGAAPAPAADVTEKLPQCLACHGEKGQSQIESVPSIGAQPENYTIIQLFMYREKLRVADAMNEAAKELSDADIQALAAAVAALPPPKPPDEADDQGRLEQAKPLSEKYRCNICHRPDFAGQQTVPRLADQREDYLLKTLRDYKSGARRAYEPTMVEVLQPIDDGQLAEFAYYLSRLR